jgi:CRP/FNR family transcriptional regulator, cyclic AMP receptor protein
MARGSEQRDFKAALERSWTRPTVKDWAAVLGGLPLFAGISQRRLRKLATLAKVEEFSPGEIVIKQGDLADAFYVVLAGRAKVMRKNGRALRPGDYFGEMGLIDGQPRSATIAAADQLQTMRLPRRPFLKLLEDEPGIGIAMLAELAGRVRRLERRTALAD